MALLLLALACLGLQGHAIVLEENSANAAGLVHVVVSADKVHRTDAVFRSVLRHASGPVQLYQFMLDTDPDVDVERVIDGHPVKTIKFGEEEVEPFVNQHYKPISRDYGNFKSPYNYARFIMADKLPNVDKVLYLDADVLVTLDVNKFVKEHLTGDHVIAAFPKKYKSKYDDKISDVRKAGFSITPQKQVFSAGVMLWSLAAWRKGGWASKFQELINANNDHKWWDSRGSTPPLHMLFGDDKFEHLPYSMMQHDMGWRSGFHIQDPPGGSFYHWEGPHKPWLHEGFHKVMFGKYTHDKNEKVPEKIRRNR